MLLKRLEWGVEMQVLRFADPTEDPIYMIWHTGLVPKSVPFRIPSKFVRGPLRY